MQFQERSEAKAVSAAVVADDRQVTGTLLTQGIDEDGGDSDETESTDSDRRTVGNIGHGIGGGGKGFVEHGFSLKSDVRLTHKRS